MFVIYVYDCLCVTMMLSTVNKLIFTQLMIRSQIPLLFSASMMIFEFLGSFMELIDSPITCEVTTDIKIATDKCFIIRTNLAVDNQALYVQQSETIAMIAISPIYCA